MIYSVKIKLRRINSMALKECVECKKEISNEVKKCPNCGKDQRNWFLRHKIITFIGFLGILIVLGAAFNSKNEDNKKATTSIKTSETVAAAPQKTEVVKELTKNGISSDVEINILESKTEKKLGNNPFSEIKAQGIFKVLKIQLKNNQKDAVTISSGSFKLIDDKKREFGNSSEAEMALASSVDDKKETFFLKKINPGISITGYVAYDVPEDAKGFKLSARGGMTGEEIFLKVD
jgi:hypothetical protein